MVLKNIIDVYNLCAENLDDIERLEDNLKNILQDYNNMFSSFCLRTLPLNGGVDTNYGSDTSSKFNAQRKAIEHKLTTLILDISIISKVLIKFESYKISIDSKNNIYIVIDNFISSTNNLIVQIYDFFKEVTLKSKAPKFYNLYLTINEYLITISNFKHTIKLLNNIYNSVSYNTSDLLKDDSYSILEIQYFRKELEFSDMAEIMDNTEKLYNKLCEIFGISLTQYKLKPIKIESGSMFEALAGNASVIAFMEFLFKHLKNPGSKLAKFIYKNYTTEGIHKNVSELFKEDLELFAAAKELGLEIPKDIAEENLAQITKHTTKLLDKGKFTINGNEIISEDPEQLRISATPQIEDSSSNVNESDISTNDDNEITN